MNCGCQLRKVLSGIALTGDKEISVSIFGILSEDKCLQEFEHVIRDLLHGRGQWVAIRESGTERLINKHHIYTLVNPGTLVIARQVHLEVTGASAVSGHTEWSIFCEKPEHRGGAGASIEPEYEWRIGPSLIALEQPIEEVVICVRKGIRCKSTWIHARQLISGVPEWQISNLWGLIIAVVSRLLRTHSADDSQQECRRRKWSHIDNN